MKKLISFSLLLGLIVGTTNAAFVLIDKADVIGEWKYDAMEAPYGYQKGVVVITEDSGILKGEVKFDSGYIIQLKEVALEKDMLKMGLYVDYEYVTIKVKVNGAKMEGTVYASIGEIALKAVKK